MVALDEYQLALHYHRARLHNQNCEATECFLNDLYQLLEWSYALICTAGWDGYEEARKPLSCINHLITEWMSVQSSGEFSASTLIMRVRLIRCALEPLVKHICQVMLKRAQHLGEPVKVAPWADVIREVKAILKQGSYNGMQNFRTVVEQHIPSVSQLISTIVR